MSQENEKAFPVGSFCWVELGTSDRAAARSFYEDLLGYTHEEVDMGEMGTYTLLKLDGKDVAGLYALTPEQQEQSLPPHWLSYVRVEDADATVARARDLGGAVHVEPTDVPGVGRMAVLADPMGASFALMKAEDHPGATPMDNRPGIFCWQELRVPDPQAAAGFYGELFGWTADASDPSYMMFLNDGRLAGGAAALTEEMQGVPPSWTVYFSVADCDASTSKAREGGAQVVVPPMTVPEIGRFAVLADPQGAAFALIHLETPESNG